MEIVLVKLGTSCVWKHGLLEATMDACAELMNAGFRIIIVSSGAIEAGVRRITRKWPTHTAPSLYSKSTLAAFGALPLLQLWQRAMAPYRRLPVPLWVTHRNLTDSDERSSIRDLIRNVLEGTHGIIVANENDAVSHEEINHWEHGLGENDHLAEALVRLLKEMDGIRVRGVYFGTLVGGYYAPWPPDASTALVPEISVDAVPHDQLLAFIHPAFSESADIRNDMVPKLCAAAVCVRHGVPQVGIGTPTDVANFMLRTPLFKGTRVVPVR